MSFARRFRNASLSLFIPLVFTAIPGFSQGPPTFPPATLDSLVSRIALYPDSLLAQVLAAATFPDQIPDAARWADQHHYLTGQALADAIQSDAVPWDVSVQALLPFPSVLDMMASDMNWTQDLGNAFLAQQADVMNAVQRQRQIAYRYGYLRSNAQVVVTPGPYITIAPVNPGYIVVPAYDPRVVYYPPRPGFVVAGGIGWGFGISIGGFFRPWGWGVSRIGWGEHAVFIDQARWGRTWVNRGTYVHPYTTYRPVAPRAVPMVRPGEPRSVGRPTIVEHHELHPRTEMERQAPRRGESRPHEEHRDEHHR
jgi:hypothetical protein